MKRSGKHGKHDEKKRMQRMKPEEAREKPSFIKMEARFKISPKHPGGGRG